jgi:hypothetical protein
MDRVMVGLASRPWVVRLMALVLAVVVAACEGGGGTTRDY